MSLQLAALTAPYVEFDFTRMAFDTRVSFSRSSDGTYFDAAGVMQTAASNVPRKEHNPATGAVRGLLVEEQRTNIVLRSQEFNNSSWTKSGATVSGDTSAAPDGTTTADKLTESAATGVHYTYVPPGTLTASTTYALSVMAKSAERSRFQIAGSGGAWGASKTATFDLAAGTVVGSNWDAAYIVPLQAGWYRCIAIGTTVAMPAAAQYFQLPLIASGTTQSYTGDGTSGLYLWGAQLEAGSYPTSYIPTTSATVTRSADVPPFTIPPRVVRLVTIYDDGTTSQQAVTPGASYTIPTGQKPILRIRGYYV